MFDFSTIDEAIQNFRQGKYGIFISRKARSDWFEFQYRSVEWEKDHFKIIVEIFPDLDKEGNSISWNLSMLIHRDENGRRYYYKETFLRSVSFDEVEKNIYPVLSKKYEQYNSSSPAMHDLEFIELKK